MNQTEMIKSRADVRSIRRGVYVVSSALVTIMVIVMGLLVYFGVRSQNDATAHASEKIVTNAVEHIYEQMVKPAKDYGWWDETYEHLTLAFDSDWASENINEYLVEDFGYGGAMVIIDQNEAIHFYLENVESGPENFVNNPDLAFLIWQAREQTWEEPETVSGFINVDGQIYATVVMAITAESIPENVESLTRSVLILFNDVDWVAEQIGQIFLDRSVTAMTQDVELWPWERMPIASATGTDLGALAWKSDRPGDIFLNKVMLPV